MFWAGMLNRMNAQAIMILLAAISLWFGDRPADASPVTTGSLFVTIKPAGAVSAGAQWRRVGQATWRDSATTESGVTTGAHAIEFKPLTLWRAPANQNVTVLAGQTVQTTITYGAVGALKVTITPPEAAAAGAQWRYVGSTTWLNSGTSITAMAAGNYTLEFKATADCSVAAPQVTTITAGQITDLTVPYVPLQSGVSWSTYLGGNYDDTAYDVALDGDGCIIITGRTRTQGWISGGYDTTISGGNGGNADAFVVKLAPDGRHIWSTYLGGDMSDYGYGVAADNSGAIYVSGYTYSQGWIVGGADTTFGGSSDGFVAKLSPDGDFLWSSYVGGAGDDIALEIAVQGSDIYVVGRTTAAGTWISGGSDVTFNGGASDAFVMRLKTDGRFVWSTLFGGSGDDFAQDVAISPGGNIALIGQTNSAGLGIGKYANTAGGFMDGYVALLAPDSSPLWCSYLGGSGSDDNGCNVAVDGAGNVFAAGWTGCAGWISGGFDTTYAGGTDAYVAKFSPEGQPLWSTYLGGAGSEYCNGLTLDRFGNPAVTGSTGSKGWVAGGFRTDYNGCTYLIQLTSAGQHRWSAYLGGSVNEHVQSLAADRWGDLCVVGYTQDNIQNNWASGGYNTTPYGTALAADGFLVKIHSKGGALRLTLEPAEAVATGARWRPVGTTTWLESGATTATGFAGPRLVEFKPVSGWAEPDTQFLGVAPDGVTTASFAYVHRGSLSVTIEPPQAALSGARWRRVGTTPWLASGDIETSVPARAALIEFNAVADWQKPGNKLSITVAEGWLTTATGVYAAMPGKLQVNISPPEAIGAGARWRRVGQADWLMSATIETGLPPGPCDVEFKPASGYDTPPNMTVRVLSNQHVTTYGTYLRHTGSLQITLNPPAAAAAGVQWRRLGASTWRDSAAVEPGVPTGDYDVEFRDVSGWSVPATLKATVSKEQVTRLNAAYGVPKCWLTLTIAPAVDAGLKWRRLGQTRWFASGETDGIGEGGQFKLEFSTHPDWRTPSSPYWLTVNNGEHFKLTVNMDALRFGYLSVTITPPAAVAAGAQWRRVGTTTWFDSGMVEMAIPVGNSTVEFKQVQGWTVPRNRTVMVNEDTASMVEAVYARPSATSSGVWKRFD